MKFGAGNGTQTRDLCLGKASLYQLSYSRSRMRVTNLMNTEYNVNYLKLTGFFLVKSPQDALFALFLAKAPCFYDNLFYQGHNWFKLIE